MSTPVLREMSFGHANEPIILLGFSSSVQEDFVSTLKKALKVHSKLHSWQNNGLKMAGNAVCFRGRPFEVRGMRLLNLGVNGI